LKIGGGREGLGGNKVKNKQRRDGLNAFFRLVVALRVQKADGGSGDF